MHASNLKDNKSNRRTLHDVPPPCFLLFNDMSQEVIPRPKVLILDLIRHELLHGGSQVLILLQISTDPIRLLLYIKALLPFFEFGTGGILDEAVGAGMNDV